MFVCFVCFVSFRAYRASVRISEDAQLETIQRADGQLMAATSIPRRRDASARGTFERGRCVLQLGFRRPALHFAQRQHRVPEREFPPSMSAVTNRLKMLRPTLQPLFAPIEPARKDIAPQPHRALPTTEQTWIRCALAIRGALETLHHAFVCRFDRARHAAVSHS